MAKRKSSKSPSLFDSVDADAEVLTRPAGGGPSGPPGEERVELHTAAQCRYLNYSLSVIPSRALPDLRRPEARRRYAVLAASAR